MSDGDYPGIVQILTELWETKYGGWQQPDMMDPCRAGLGGCPVLWTTGYELRELTYVFQRNILGSIPQDAGMITFHFLNLTGGSPDPTWTTGDYTLVESAAKTWWLSLVSKYSADTKDLEFRWRADGPAYKPFGSSLQPTLRTVAASLTAGSTANQPLPPQIAVSVTEVTPAKYTVEDVEGVGTQSRNRWGRFYMPAPDILQDTLGRVTPAFATQLATSTQTFYNACVTAEIVPVMYSPTTGKAWSITEVHVDDIFDVIRSRRYVTPLARNIKTINQVA